jgi:hypothetical protein
MVYNIEPKSDELKLSLSKYEKQNNLGLTSMTIGIVGVMTGHIIVNSIKNVDELTHDRMNQINFLTFTPISIFGVYNVVRAPRHIKKYID